MNTLDITRLDDGRIRVTIRSEGERDQHVDITLDELRSHFGALDVPAAEAIPYRDPEPPAVGEPPTTTPGDGAAITEDATVTKREGEQ